MSWTLLLDTVSPSITIALANIESNELDISVEGSIKPSLITHQLIHEKCSKFNISPSEIKNIIYCAGPGSYTGMRLNKGIADIFALNSVNIYSYYSFEVPEILGVKNYHWVANAFKAQYFLFDSTLNKGSLLDKGSFEDLRFTSLYGEVLNDHLDYKHISFSEDTLLAIIKKIVSRNIHKPLYYYRSLIDEFKVN